MNVFTLVKGYFSSITIRNKLKKASNIRIIIGAGQTSYPDWISTDFPLLDITEKKSWANLFDNIEIDAILSEHVFEHLNDAEVISAFSNIHEYLKIGGYIRIAVPDGFHPNDNYIQAIKPGGSGLGSEDHKQLFNFKSLSTTLENCGFHVNLLEWFDEKGNFNFNEWSINDGMVSRSSRYDERNHKEPLTYTSLIIDAFKFK